MSGGIEIEFFANTSGCGFNSVYVRTSNKTGALEKIDMVVVRRNGASAQDVKYRTHFPTTNTQVWDLTPVFRQDSTPGMHFRLEISLVVPNESLQEKRWVNIVSCEFREQNRVFFYNGRSNSQNYAGALTSIGLTSQTYTLPCGP